MKVLYYLSYATLYLLSLLPLRALYALSDLIFMLVYHVAGYRRQLVFRNMSDAYPEKSPDEIRAVGRAFYHWFCDYMVETVKLMTISRRQLMRRMVFKNAELLDQLFREGHSVALYLGHYCNWEWVSSIPLWVHADILCGQIYHPLENKDYDRMFLNLRQRMGATSIPMAETLRRIVQYRREGRQVIIGYISDQIPFWNNIHHWLRFLNHDTPVLTGTERLIRQTGHAVVYLDMQRPRRGYYVGEFKLVTCQPKEMPEFEITDIYFRMLEETINRAPQYWLWTHNRWKRSREEFNLRYDKETGRVSLEPLEVIKRRKEKRDES